MNGAFDLNCPKPDVYIDEIEFDKQYSKVPVSLSEFPKLGNARIWNNVDTHSPTWKH